MAAEDQVKPNIFEFGEFWLDLSDHALRRNGEIVVLQPRVLDTLILLVKRRGEILTKAEMMDAIWKDAFVEEANLTQSIYLLRRTLGKNADGEDWIKTLPRKGYTFVAPLDEAAATRFGALSQTQPARPAFPRRQSIIVIAAASLLIAVFFLIGFAVIRRPAAEAAESRNVDFQKLTFSGDIDFPVIAPDGNSFAFSRYGKIVIQQIDSGQQREISLPDEIEAGFVRFLPDGKRIAFRDERRFYLKGNVLVVPLDGGATEKLAENVWSGFSFSHDAQRIAFVRDVPEENRHQLIIKDLAKNEERVVGQLTDPSRYIFVGGPDWSPDDKRLAIAASKREGQAPRSQLTIYDIATGATDDIAPPQIKQFEHVAWMPDGRSLVVVARENQKFFQIWSLSYPDGKLAHITNDLNSSRNLTASADGKKLLATNYVTFSHIWTTSAADLGKFEQKTFGSLNRDGTVGMDWLPDGSIVYATRIFGNVDIWKAGPGELDKSQLTREAGDGNAAPAISADGSSIYFSSNRTGNTQIWRMRASDGGEQTQITFGEKETNEFPQPSPDGKWLYFVRKSGKEPGVWRRSLADGKEEPLPIVGKLTPQNFLAISPDGRFLATCNLTSKREDAVDQQNFEIAVIPTDKREMPRFFNSPNEWVTWSPDSTAFDIAIYRNGDTVVERRAIDGSMVTRLFDLKGEYVANMLWSRDGTSLAISRGKRQNDAVLIDLNSK